MFFADENGTQDIKTITMKVKSKIFNTYFFSFLDSVTLALHISVTK